MRRLLFLLLPVLLLCGAVGWWWYQPEKVIARRVAGLFETASFEADAGNFTRGTRGEAIAGYLAPEITFEGPDGATEEVNGRQSREDIVSMYSSLSQFARRISLEAPEIDSIAIDGDEALVEARVDAIIELRNEKHPVDGIQHLAMTWRKIEGKWQLAAAKWRETGR